MKQDLYDTVTQQIITSLESADLQAGDWVRPWRGGCSSMPQNAVSKNFYRGGNIISLWMMAAIKGYDQQQWATYRQWQSLGAQVRKGETGTGILFYKTVQKDEDNSYAMARQSKVFNIAQVEGYTLEPVEETNIEPIDRCAAFFETIPARIKHTKEGRAYYSPSTDGVTMPPFEWFEQAEHYYSTLGHELVHWTGHRSRLDREMLGKFMDEEAYAKEELVAELGAAFITAMLGIDNVTRDDHSRYLKSWLSALRNDNKLIFRAATQASAAVDYLIACEKERIAA